MGIEGGAGTKSLVKYLSSSALANGSVSISFGVPVRSIRRYNFKSNISKMKKIEGIISIIAPFAFGG